MECREIRKLLSPFVDNELGAHDAFTVAEHLEACVPCQREMQHLRRLDERLKAAGLASVEGVDEVPTQPFSLPWLDPHSLQDVLHQEGLVDLPNLAPAGFHLEGARICYPLSHPFVQLVYRNRSEEISLFVSRRWSRPLAGVSKREGFTIVPLGMRAVFLVSREPLDNFADVHQLAEEEVSALSA